MTTPNHELWMSRALVLAERAGEQGEVPVGAVVVLDDELIGEGHNQPLTTCDPSAHAKIVAIRDAARRIGNYRLSGARLYVTIEPCTMCAGAIIHSRIAQLVFGATEPRAGVVQSQRQALDESWLNHHTSWLGGVMADECAALMKSFFAARR